MTYELLAVLICLQKLAKPGDRLIVHVDNMGAAYSCVKGANSNSLLDNAIIAAICFLCKSNNIKVYFHYISTERNPADPASRLKDFEKYLNKLGKQYKKQAADNN